MICEFQASRPQLRQERVHKHTTRAGDFDIPGELVSVLQRVLTILNLTVGKRTDNLTTPV